MKWVIKGVHIVPMGFANAFLIEGDDGMTLIDSGFPGKESAVLGAIRALGRSPDQPTISRSGIGAQTATEGLAWDVRRLCRNARRVLSKRALEDVRLYLEEVLGRCEIRVALPPCSPLNSAA